jgi:hypothetical protein
MAGSTRHDRVAKLLEVAGATLSEQAGIRLQNKPAPLFQLIVLVNLLTKTISGNVAIAACRELIAAEMTTPAKMRRATWQRRVEALGRAHYRRYDESTATRLGEASQLVIDRYGGDLRRLAEQTGQDRRRAVEPLQEIPGIGPTGTAIFLPEVQGVWSWVRPYLDGRAVAGAKKLELPTAAASLARLSPDPNPARLAAALVRADLDDSIANSVLN